MNKNNKLNKKLFFLLVILFIFLIGCSKSKQDFAQKDGKQIQTADSEIKEQPKEEKPAIPSTGESSIDAIGDEIKTADNVDKELDTSELNDLDDTLQDIENI